MKGLAAVLNDPDNDYGVLLYNIVGIDFISQLCFINCNGNTKRIPVSLLRCVENTGIYDQSKWSDLNDKEREALVGIGKTAMNFHGFEITENDVLGLFVEGQIIDRVEVVKSRGIFRIRGMENDMEYPSTLAEELAASEKTGIIYRVIDTTIKRS